MFAWRILYIQWNRNLLTSTSSEVLCHRGCPCKNGKMKEIGVSPTGKFRKNTRASIACKRSVCISLASWRIFLFLRGKSRKIEIANHQRHSLEDPPYGCVNVVKISSYFIGDSRRYCCFLTSSWSHQPKYCITSQIIVSYRIKSSFTFQ